jgi:hypothetical protein
MCGRKIISFFKIVTPRTRMGKKTLKTHNNNSQVSYTKVHIWWICNSSLCIHGESYISNQLEIPNEKMVTMNN